VLFEVDRLEWVVVAGLAVFGVAFAVNSSIHSYLILAYAGSEKAAEDVGFYYAANALGASSAPCCPACCTRASSGRLAGRVAAMLAACWLVTLALPVERDQGRAADVTPC